MSREGGFMKEIKAEAVKKLEVGSSVWIRKKGRYTNARAKNR